MLFRSLFLLVLLIVLHPGRSCLHCIVLLPLLHSSAECAAKRVILLHHELLIHAWRLHLLVTQELVLLLLS